MPGTIMDYYGMCRHLFTLNRSGKVIQEGTGYFMAIKEFEWTVKGHKQPEIKLNPVITESLLRSSKKRFIGIIIPSFSNKMNQYFALVIKYYYYAIDCTNPT